MQYKRKRDPLASIHQRRRRACLWTDDVRSHVVWSLVVATMAKKTKEVAKNKGQAIPLSSVEALCALARVCSTTRIAVQDATIFVDALFATDGIPDEAWSHPDERAVEIRTRFDGDSARPIDYSARGRLLGRRTTLNRRNGGYSHVTFKNLPQCDESTFVLFRGYLGSEPAYYRFTVDDQVADRICSGEQDDQWDDDDDDDNDAVTFAIEGTMTRWGMRGCPTITRHSFYVVYPRMHVDYVDVWCYAAGPD